MTRIVVWMTTRFSVTVAVMRGSLHLKKENVKIYFALLAELNLLLWFSMAISNVFPIKAVSLKMRLPLWLVGLKFYQAKEYAITKIV
jgi:hypothetical protein